jgi:hypothetical protein
VLEDIAQEIHDITVAQRISTPAIFDNLNYFVLGFYLLVLVPLQIYSNVESWIVLIYPAVLVIYVGPIIYGFWLGDPLMRYPRFEGPTVLAWRHKLYIKIKTLLFDELYTDIMGHEHLTQNPDSFVEELRARNSAKGAARRGPK